MKKNKVKGLWLFIVAALICYVLKVNIGSDVYSISLDNDDFNHRYLVDYTYDSCEPVEYTGKTGGNVDVYTLSNYALSLEPGTYDLRFSYTANDDSTVLKIFSSDYVSEDNSGGKILLYENLNPAEGYLKASFELDQKVHSVYILVETTDSSFGLHNLLLESWGTVCTDTYYYMAMTILCAIILFIALNMNWSRITPVTVGGIESTSVKTVMAFVAIGAIAVMVASIPLMKNGFYKGHDFQFHAARIEGIAQGLLSGQFPVRVHGETLNGYGYANSMFYPELFMYFPALLSIMGVSTITAYKSYIVFMHILTLVCSYIPFKKMTDSRYMAVAMAVVYMLNPYRHICAYYRSALGEFAALTFLPLVIYGIYAVVKGNQRDWPYLVFGATGVLQCHILTTELTAFMAAVLVLVAVKNLFTNEKRWWTLIKSGVYAVMLNVWFIVPMLLMIISIRPAVFTRVQSPSGYAVKDMSYLFTTVSVAPIGPHAIGWISLIGIALYLLYRIIAKTKPEDGDKLKFYDVLLWCAIICAFATTAYFPWSKITAVPIIGRMLDTIQFPYRLMSLVGVCCIFLFGYAVMLWLKNKNHRIMVCVAAVLVSSFTSMLFYEFVFVRTETGETPTKHYYVTNMNTSLSVGQYEYLPSAADLYDMVTYSPKITSDNDTLAISGLERQGTVMDFEYTMSLTGTEQDIIKVPLTYIPGYDVYVNGQKVEELRNGNYQLSFMPSETTGSVHIKYTGPIVFRLFDIVSLVTLIWLIIPKKYLGFINEKVLDFIK